METNCLFGLRSWPDLRLDYEQECMRKLVLKGRLAGGKPRDCECCNFEFGIRRAANVNLFEVQRKTQTGHWICCNDSLKQPWRAISEHVDPANVGVRSAIYRTELQ